MEGEGPADPAAEPGKPGRPALAGLKRDREKLDADTEASTPPASDLWETPRPEGTAGPAAQGKRPKSDTAKPTDGDAKLKAAGPMVTDSTKAYDRKLLPGDQTPAIAHERGLSTSSSISEMSSVSASTERHRNFSPLPASMLPPAPPSTPASHASIFTFDGAATPLPMHVGVLNAAQLEQQQLLASEGAETPAPTRTPAPGTKSTGMLPEDFSDWAVGDRYNMVRMLGRGSYGEVAQAIDLHAGRPDAYVAIKRIQSPFEQEVDAVRLYREIHILRRMRGHECIINLIDVVQPPSDDLDEFNDLYLVFEYVDTDLYKLIMSPQYLTTEHIQTFLYQMLVGLKYIHSFSVIHRDLKPANILLNEDCSLKICDFGLARIVDTTAMVQSSRHGWDDETSEDTKPSPNLLASPPKVGLTRQLTKHVVTRWYRAPELILIQPYTSAVDMWGLGCILAELLSMQEGNATGYQDRKPLFPGGTCYPLSGEDDSAKTDERLDQLSVIFNVIGTPSPEEVAVTGKASKYIESLGKIEGRPFEKIYPVADPAAIDLLKKMLQFNPEKRCTAEEALDHSFFAGVRRKDMERVSTEGPLDAPDFLKSNQIDLKLLKQYTLEEVLWFRNQPSPASSSAMSQSKPPSA